MGLSWSRSASSRSGTELELLLERLVTPDLLGFLGSSEGILTGSNRWNPHADVAELVDALVSGSLPN